MNNTAPPSLGISVIMPVMDETVSLTETIQIVMAENASDIREIICVVSAHSTAEALAVCSSLATEWNGVVKVRQQKRPYLGGALRDSFEWAEGSYILLMASDLETDPYTVKQMIAEARKGWHIVATTRWRQGGSFDGYNPVKYVLNWVFQKVIGALYNTRLSDLTYGFRLYRAEVLRNHNWEELRHPFLLECLLRPLHLGATATEIPVRWEARREGESHNPFWRNFLYFRTALKVRFSPKPTNVLKPLVSQTPGDSSVKTTIVTTTINVPQALSKYSDNARFYGHRDVKFVVIGDRKTPDEARDFCTQLGAGDYPCEYLGIEDQRGYLERFPALWQHLPFDSIQRRNIGLLKAWEDGADVIITIDDDNWMLNQDFIGLHGIAGSTRELPAIESTSGWFNVCSTLEEVRGQQFYHRGFPMGERWKEAEAFTCVAPIRQRVAVNAGLWLDDPDIDAMTRIERPIVVKGMSASAHSTFALQPGTWSPFNSQNTALARDVIPAYFLSPCVGRYDDIWPSYILTRIANHFGDVIAYGHPLLRQKRNVHNLWRDLDAERIGMLLTDEFCAALRSIALHGTTYRECYAELAAVLPRVWQPGENWTEPMRAARKGLLEGMSIWSQVFARLATSGVVELANHTRNREETITTTRRLPIALSQ